MTPRNVILANDRFRRAVEWLLQNNQPSIRFLTLTELLGRKTTDNEVDKARRQIPLRGWVKQLFETQKEDTYWVRPTSCYMPKCTATVWHLQLLAVLGVENSDQRIKNACEKFLRMHTMPDGGFTCSASLHPGRRSEECITGRMVAVVIHFGFQDDERVRRAIRWLIDHQLKDGGWNCHSPWKKEHSSIYSTYMALWGLSKVPHDEKTGEIGKAIQRGIEFMLAHRLFKSHRTGRVIEERWLKFGFPPNVAYDVLHSLRLLGDLGTVHDERLQDAIEVVESKAQRSGRWLLDRVPGRPERIELEKAAQPSKWITLQSLIVLSRAGRIRMITKPPP